MSVHVPCHAEPPRVVIGTLDCLARLDYPDFEVLVIDNNTTDPELWLPVQAHCERLGPRFRFLHVEGLTGAKAGALNWALGHTCPRAELIAVVDADYQVRRGWLAATAGYFANPAMGFVQCPHAYRGYAWSALGRWANWEYAVFFATGMVSLDAHRAGITVGTMSLIRRAALEAVRATPRQALGGILAFAALTHVITTASLRALFRRPARWQRTSKFRPPRRGVRALTCASAETVLGVAGLLAAAGLAAYARGGIATALAIGLAVQGLTYLTAPLVALAADRSLARAAGNLLDIPAVAIAAGLHQPGHPAPGRPHSTSTRARAPQLAGRSRAQQRAQHGLASRTATRPGPERDVVTGRHHSSPPAGRTHVGMPRPVLIDGADDDGPREPSDNRYDSYGSWYRSA